MKPVLAMMLSLLSAITLTGQNPIEPSELFVYESGTQNSQTIVFLHGSGSNHKMWTKHIAALENTFHCIAPDLPGHGKSNHIEWTRLNEVADTIARIIQTRGHGKVHVVGLSLGGSLIYRLLEKYPELIDRAVIDGASAVPIKGSRFIIAGVYMVSPFLKTNMMMKTMAKGLDIPEEEYPAFREDMQMVSRKSFRRAMAHANRLELDLDQFTLHSPVFFVSGETESETMHASHRRLTSKFPQCESAFYPGKGHAWMVSDNSTHIQLVRYWLLNEAYPERLKPLAGQ